MPNDPNYSLVLRIMRKYGWELFAPKFTINFAGNPLETDLALEKLIGLENQNKRIILELKSYASMAINSEVQRLVGQIKQYTYCLKRDNLPYDIFLTISIKRYNTYIEKGDYLPFFESERIKYLVYHSSREEVLQWHPDPLN